VSRDPGLQPERTRLAWRRTVLAMTVVAMLTVRLSLSLGVAGALLAALALAGWVGVVAVTYRRIGAMSQPRPGAAGRALPLSALATVGYAVLGALLVLSSMG
jgi:uncharacterized membrane protein YidH (DUF202 family)